MKPGTLLFVILVVGYLGLEGYVASRTKYRMEPDYIFGQYTEAATAVAACGGFEQSVRDKFQSNLRYTRRRAAEALSEQNPGQSAAAIESLVAAQEATAQRTTAELVDSQGCNGTDVRQLITRFKNRARLNLPTGE
ncbi:MAG: hypothetical protein V2J12_12590 [Gammaproteobacteria bacterium]|jgi:hypothetical protein|nr:hypothetical protein [Gammaproteobacteria bacterium]